MNAFRFSHEPIDSAPLRAELVDVQCGGFTAFEGWVRNHNEGQQVTRLDYEAFEALGVREGERIMQEARERFGVTQVLCVHRLGTLALTDIAVWVGAAAAHRENLAVDRAFLAEQPADRRRHLFRRHGLEEPVSIGRRLKPLGHSRPCRGRDGIDQYALADPLEREAAHHADDRRLGGAIGAGAKRAIGAAGCQIDDPAVALAGHVRPGRLGEP
jgi:molybdopterin synthase catalytic subunit